MFKRLWRKFGPNPFEVLLRKAQQEKKSTFLIAWNRGLGDVALGLYAMVYRIRQVIPEAKITFMTRSDLVEGFSLLDGIEVIECASWRRKTPFDLEKSILESGKWTDSFSVKIAHPDPTWWVKWQLGTLVPQMRWKNEWDALYLPFGLEKRGRYLGVHVQTETSYGYEKNWPLSHWLELFERLYVEKGIKVILFGHVPNPVINKEGIIDLRGKTSLLEMLSIIKNCCSYLVVPDSGVLSLTYYLNVSFPIKIVSLWADPRQGVLKQNVRSPNPELIHIPLLGEEENVSSISIDNVWEALFTQKAEHPCSLIK